MSKHSDLQRSPGQSGGVAGLARSCAFKGTNASSAVRCGVAAALLAVAVVLGDAVPAFADFAPIGEIVGPAPGVHFGDLKAESVAVDDHNGHIFVADSSTGLI